MINHRILLTLSVVLALWAGLGLGKPSVEATEKSEATPAETDHYNPQCLPLDDFEKDQSKESRKKRDEQAVLAEPASGEEEIVAQPGYVVPAGRRWPCLGRRKNFTALCGPPNKAYRVKNFVMAKNPFAKLAELRRAKAQKFGNLKP